MVLILLFIYLSVIDVLIRLGEMVLDTNHI